MVSREELEGLAGRIAAVKREIGELQTAGRGFACVERNALRMLACVRMLELEITDAAQN